ncbi:MAG: type 1 pili tip component [Porticoccaceae bacterium]|jgi:hypothetical protein|nr:type 1 pili tip component [Porticoccaceae bacterium]MEA3300723.1 hypothetical protein [Pseudomonadota bacterium]HLS98662.1 type 1 pili tip component [Porticoccaceae bacterium]
MTISTFAALLDQWEMAALKKAAQVKREISLFENDDVKLRALSAMYSLPVEEITASLLHQALLELEEKMPYVAGERVIRVEEGANIYEDVGPMARYLEAQKALRNGGAG